MIDGIVSLWWMACMEVAIGTLSVLAYEWYLQRRDYQKDCAARLRHYAARDAAAVYGRRSDDGYQQYRPVDDRRAA